MENECFHDAGIPTGGHRSWSDLPELALASILDRLLLFPDLFSFGGVCFSWRSVFLDSLKDPLRSRPPLLLWLGHSPCRLTDPSAEPAVVSYPCMISSPTLTPDSCIRGSSFGNLIFADYGRIIIAAVLTGKEIVTPELPCDPRVYNGFLTAPPSSPGCGLILSNSTGRPLLMWRVGADESWFKHLLSPPIHQLLLFKQRVYALDYDGRIHTLRFSPQLSFEPLEGVGPPPPYLGRVVQQLVKCGDELFCVSFGECEADTTKLKFSAFRIDFSQKSWVEVKDFDDWALFIDSLGTCPSTFVSTTRWRGGSNCVYIVGCGCDSWRVHPLNRDYYSRKELIPFWPTPIWIYSSM